MKYRIDNLDIMEGGRLGLLLCGYSDIFEFDVVIKIIPDFLNSFDIELKAYKLLSRSYMCPLIDYDPKDNVLILKKLNGKPFDFKTEKDLIKRFFDNVYANLSICKNIEDNKSYKDILINNINKIKNINFDFENRSELEKNVIDIYENEFETKPQYLIHGDLHANNVLHDENDLKAIDPLGYVTSIDFTFVRFIFVELFYANEIENYFDELLDFISSYTNKEDLLKALLIDGYLFLTTLFIQVDKPDKLFVKVKKIIQLILNKMKELGVDYEYEKNCNNLTKTRKCFFRG